MSSNRVWHRTHRYNAIFLSAFIVVHMATHLSGALGIETYNAVQSVFRVVYRHPAIEVLLLCSVIGQMLLGLGLVARRLRPGAVRGFWGWLQIVSGCAFFLFMAQHLFSLAMTRIYFDLDTDFYWPASVMSGPWFIYYFWPYYVIGVFAVFAHIAAGLRFVLLEKQRPIAARRAGVSILFVGGAVALSIPPIIAGFLYPVDLPEVWVDYLQFYAPNFQPR